MEKFKTYAAYLAVSVVGTLLALKLYENLNKPKIAPPATAPATTAKQ